MLRKVIRLIPDSFRKKGVLVTLFVPIRALLDLMGVAVLLPVLILVLDGGSISDNTVLNTLYTLFEFSDNRDFIIFLVVSILSIIILKSVINLLFINYQNKYLLSLYKYFSAKLFSLLYGRGLLYVKNSNSSEIAFNINAVCYNFVVVYLASVLKFSGEIIFCTFILIALCFYNPLSALFIILSFLPVVLVYLILVRSRLKKYGRVEMEARRQQQKVVQETFKGYAEMEINNAFPLMKEKFQTGLDVISKYRIKSSLIQSIPSYLLEIAVALVVCAMVVFSLNADDASMRVFLGVFTVAIIRMLPSVHSLIGTWGGIKSTQYTIDVIEEFYKENPSPSLASDKTSSNNIIFNKAIAIKNLSFSYSTGMVIDNLSFEIHKGEKFGLRGRTGAGKSTLFNLLLGFFPPQKGSIEIDGVPLSSDNVGGWQKIVGYVPQDVFIADLSMAENIALGQDMENIDKKKILSILEQVSLIDFVKNLPQGLNTVLGEGGSKISGGQRQRIGIARALYKNAEVLFFDEATSSLDSKTEKEINQAIQELSDTYKQLTIIIIAHRESSLSICDKIFDI
jgi:ATP-binding cassette, subfamily B, bacterial PglK